MMLGSRPARLRGLGAGCVTFDLGAIQQQYGGGSQGVPFNLITAQQETSGNGGCMPDQYLQYMSQDYLDTHTVGGPMVDYTTGRVDPNAPVTAAGTHVVLPAGYVTPTPVVTAPAQVTAARPDPVVIGQNGAPLSATGVPMVNTTQAIGTGGSEPAPGATSGGTTATATSSSSSTIFGIDPKYLAIGAVALLFLMGRK